MVNRTPVKESEAVGVDLEEAIKVMGEEKVFPFEEVKKLFKFDPEILEGLDLNRIPYSKETLEKFKNTHFLVFILPLSLCEMAKQRPKLFNDSYRLQKMLFALEEGELGWMLVRKIPVNSQESLNETENIEETIKSHSMVFAMMVNFLINEEIIFSGKKIRCADSYFDKKKYKDMSELPVLVSLSDKGTISVDWFGSIEHSAYAVKTNR